MIFIDFLALLEYNVLCISVSIYFDKKGGAEDDFFDGPGGCCPQDASACLYYYNCIISSKNDKTRKYCI